MRGGAKKFLLIVFEIFDLSTKMLILMFLVIFLSWIVGLSFKLLQSLTPLTTGFPGGQAGFSTISMGCPNCVSKLGGGRNLSDVFFGQDWPTFSPAAKIHWEKLQHFCFHRIFRPIFGTPNIGENPCSTAHPHWKGWRIGNRSGVLSDCDFLFRLGKPCEASYPTCHLCAFCFKTSWPCHVPSHDHVSHYFPLVGCFTRRPLAWISGQRVTSDPSTSSTLHVNFPSKKKQSGCCNSKKKIVKQVLLAEWNWISLISPDTLPGGEREEKHFQECPFGRIC